MMRVEERETRNDLEQRSPGWTLNRDDVIKWSVFQTSRPGSCFSLLFLHAFEEKTRNEAHSERVIQYIKNPDEQMLLPMTDARSKVTKYKFFNRIHLPPVRQQGTKPRPDTIQSLMENDKYLFRLRATNSRGASEPMDTVTPVTIQDIKGKTVS